MVTRTIEADARGDAFPEAGRASLYIVGALIALRVVTAAYLPLSFDESYFWLWSKHLAVSYYDHPPLIALAIKLGTLIFGDTEFGVRAASLAASIGASWAVWRAAAILTGNEAAGGLACCFFNATLMIASQSMAATPDALVLAASAFVLLGVAKLQDTLDGRWWLAIGAALGAAFLTKYTAFFLGAGVALWLIGTREGRIWLRSPWPYAAALLAFACLAPNLLWNAAHDWISFRFQFGRVVSGAPTIRYFLEFVGGQFALASPFILILAVAGLTQQTWRWPATEPLAIAAAIMWPALIYFTVHSIHDRVQGNWPSFIYPALAVLAAAMAVSSARRFSILAISRMLALPVAFCVLLAVYAQILTGILPLTGRYDPVARILGVGIGPVADDIEKLATQRGAEAIVTTTYVTTGWLSFYLHPSIPIIQINEDYRWLQTPRADSNMLHAPLLYVTQNPQVELKDAAAHFASVKLEKILARRNRGAEVEKFYVYSLAGFHGAVIGRLPNAASR
ncbi:MAG TPA: glycosyltransferase family 39 protein [Rhizomicrobium sp.]|nr:glycosyltransferase family 39 protein [Rhizomicrobium sp.]